MPSISKFMNRWTYNGHKVNVHRTIGSIWVCSLINSFLGERTQQPKIGKDLSDQSTLMDGTSRNCVAHSFIHFLYKRPNKIEHFRYHNIVRR